MSLTIQTHPERFEAVPFVDQPDPFVIVRAYEEGAGVSLFLRSAALCDALIAAAAEAKRLLDPPGEPSGMQSPRPVARVAEPAGEGGVLVGPWCPASTDMEDFGATLYCDRVAGHAGSHHAPGPDEGSEVAWSDLSTCECGHDAADHHENQATGDSTYCNRCDVGACGSFRSIAAEPKAGTALLGELRDRMAAGQ